MLPLYLLTNSKGQRMRVELKSGEVVEGSLTNVDNWMNVTLNDVTEYRDDTTAEKQRQTLSHSPEIYIKGVFIKCIKLQDDIIENVKQQINNNSTNNNNNRRNNNRRNNNYNNVNNNSSNNNYNRRNFGRRSYPQGHQYQNNQPSHRTDQQGHQDRNEMQTNDTLDF